MRRLELQDKEDKYFLHYEKIATRPQETWTLLLQSVLTGKARAVYSILLVEYSSRDDSVKNAINTQGLRTSSRSLQTTVPEQLQGELTNFYRVVC